MHALYQLAAYLLFAVLWPALLLHPKLRHGIRQRLGLYQGPIAPGGGPRIWLHGASAGDLLALLPVIEGLRRRLPECRLIVSTMTNSGQLMARERIRGVDAVVYQPYDLAGATRRTVAALAPDLLVLEYTEIWPGLIRAVRRSGALVALTNGRFSARHLRRYRWLFALIGNPLRDIDLFLMREDVEAERALALGAPLDRVWVTGNTKFDALLLGEPHGEARGLAQALGGAGDGPGGPLWIAGSTHEGEEAILLGVFEQLRQDHPTLRMAIAPRYIERAGRVLSLARERGFRAGLRSEAAGPKRLREEGGSADRRAEAAGPKQLKEEGGSADRRAEAAGPKQLNDIIVIDTMGELGQAYQLATLVFVGGSFTQRGGQNILEPAAAGKPVLFGPNMDNFHDSVQVLVGRGGIQVKDAEHLQRVVNDLLARPDRLAELGGMARAAVSAVRGAGQRDVDQLVRLLEERRLRGRRAA